MSLQLAAAGAGGMKATADILGGNAINQVVDGAQAYVKEDKKGRDYMLQNI